MSPESKNLVMRLRTLAGQSIIKPPDIDIEAAKHIEKLERELTALRRKVRVAPNELLDGQLETDIPWRRVQPDSFCDILTHTTAFNGSMILRTWSAMKRALEARLFPAALFDTDAVYAAMSLNGRHRTSPENVGDVLDAVVKVLNKQ